MKLEVHDIQGTVLNNRPMPYFGTYVVFRINEADAALTLLRRLIPRVSVCGRLGSTKGRRLAQRRVYLGRFAPAWPQPGHPRRISSRVP